MRGSVVGKVATLIDRSAEKRGRELVDARVRSFGFGGWRLLDRFIGSWH